MRRQLTSGRAGLCGLCAACHTIHGCRASLPGLNSPPSLALWVSHRGVSLAPPPPTPFARGGPAGASTSTTTIGATATTATPPTSTPSPHTPFSPQEVWSLTFPLIPCVAAFPDPNAAPSASAALPPSVRPFQIQQQLPRALRNHLELYQRTAGPLPCTVWTCKRNAKCAEETAEDGANMMMKGLGAYLVDHFPEEVAVVMPLGRLVRRERAPAATSTRVAAETLTREEKDARPSSFLSPSRDELAPSVLHEAAASPPSPPPPPQQQQTTGIVDTPTEKLPTHSSAGQTAPPPPPQPRGPSQRYGNNSSSSGTASFFGSGAVPLTGGGAASASRGGVPSETNTASLRTTIGVVEVLVEYIPTFFVNVDSIEPTLPSTIQALYADTSLRFYLKRFRHYFDLRTTHNFTEVRIRPTFDHPKRGTADARFQTGSAADAAAMQGLRRPPRNSEANLIGFIGPQVPKAFTPLADVLQEIAPIVSRHPAFDPRLGVTGLLAKYPEYFQVVDGKLRARPYREAPNSLKDLDKETTPLPHIYAKVLACVEEAAQGKNYADPLEKTAAMVSTGKLYSFLTPAEKAEVKVKCRSFPTFLRLHGKDMVVSVDKMRVYKFVPEYEACVDTLLSERLRMNALDPNDPVLKIPAEMASETNAEWAVRELYDALPLMQCAELDEVLSLVPPAVRNALPKEVADVQALLEHYPDYFTLWPYPDDVTVIVVQRAKVEQPELGEADIVRMVVPLIPQGGTTLSLLRTRAPLQLQRYFYRHGTVATLGAMKDIFAIAGDRIVRLI